MGGQGANKKKKASTSTRRWRLPWFVLPCLLAIAGYLRQRRAAAAAAAPLEQRCAAHKFSYKGLGGRLQTDTAIRKDDLCCYYGGKDYTDAEEDKHKGIAHKMASPNGGVRVAHLPPLDACGVAQLAMDRHRIELPHPTKLSSVLRAVRHYEKAAVADNSPPRQRAMTMADSLNPANYSDDASPTAAGPGGAAGRLPVGWQVRRGRCGAQVADRHADARVGAELAEPVAAAEGEPLLHAMTV